MMDEYPPIYHIINSGNKWSFTKEGRRKSLKNGDKNTVIKAALLEIVWHGGKLFVHKLDGSVDFLVTWGC